MQMPLAWITAYDKFSAILAEKNQADAILIGDSLNMTVYGQESTKNLPPDILLYHAKAVKKHAPKTEIIIDLPYKIAKLISKKSPHESSDLGGDLEGDNNFFQKVTQLNIKNIKIEGADESAQRLIKIAKSHKLEITGHLGLLPQTAQNFKVQGRGVQAEKQILQEVETLKNLGIKYLVLECIPENIGKKITELLNNAPSCSKRGQGGVINNIPTIGIGAGRHTSGQILVFDDIIGKFPPEINHKAKFAKTYTHFWTHGNNAIQNYIQDVQQRNYPTQKHIYK